MRNTNESTNARVLWFSVFSVCVLASTGAWQVYHLKQYHLRDIMLTLGTPH
eukprot:COSAG01_NODE_27146_length_693_cov_0.865320_1_plen_51_part_00